MTGWGEFLIPGGFFLFIFLLIAVTSVFWIWMLIDTIRRFIDS